MPACMACIPSRSVCAFAVTAKELLPVNAGRVGLGPGCRRARGYPIGSRRSRIPASSGLLPVATWNAAFTSLPGFGTTTARRRWHRALVRLRSPGPGLRPPRRLFFAAAHSDAATIPHCRLLTPRSIPVDLARRRTLIARDTLRPPGLNSPKLPGTRKRWHASLFNGP